MASAIKEPPFLDFGNAAELFANGLHDVEIHGTVARFVMYVERNHHGENVRVPVFALTMPVDCVAQAIGLTVRKLGAEFFPEFGARFWDGRRTAC